MNQKTRNTIVVQNKKPKSGVNNDIGSNPNSIRLDFIPYDERKELKNEFLLNQE